MARSKKAWEIEGFDSAQVIFSAQVPQGALSEKAAIELLQRLAARHLTPSEIVGASLRRNERGYLSLLEPRISADVERYVVSVGENPHYTARVQHGKNKSRT